MGGCHELICPLERVGQRVESFVPSDWNEECGRARKIRKFITFYLQIIYDDIFISIHCFVGLCIMFSQQTFSHPGVKRVFTKWQKFSHACVNVFTRVREICNAQQLCVCT